MIHTIECLCGVIATFDDWKWTCFECGREWQFDNKGYQMQTGLPKLQSPGIKKEEEAVDDGLA